MPTPPAWCENEVKVVTEKTVLMQQEEGRRKVRWAAPVFEKAGWSRSFARKVSWIVYYGTGQCKTHLYKGTRAALRLKHAVYRRWQIIDRKAFTGSSFQVVL